VKYAFVKEHSSQYRTSLLLSVLGASSSGYYTWLGREPSARAQANRVLTEKIAAFHKASRETYGSPRIHQDLVASGERVSVNRVARLMKRQGIQSKVARKFIVTTDSRNTRAPAPDRLQRAFRVERPNKAWVSDTTFIRTRQGWLYLAVVLELYSRQVIGWSMGNKNSSQLVEDALTMALWRRGEPRDIVVHSDQGSTYASGTYQRLLAQNALICSMGRRGECLDNAVAESFFGTLKNELVDHEDYRSRSEARQSVFEYIEVFYNQRRRHSTLGYLSPAEYERQNVS
jgi:transposase InsO family protein